VSYYKLNIGISGRHGRLDVYPETHTAGPLEAQPSSATRDIVYQRSMQQNQHLTNFSGVSYFKTDVRVPEVHFAPAIGGFSTWGIRTAIFGITEIPGNPGVRLFEVVGGSD
jgi:hypothetical protein